MFGDFSGENLFISHKRLLKWPRHSKKNFFFCQKAHKFCIFRIIRKLLHTLFDTYLEHMIAKLNQVVW